VRMLLQNEIGDFGRAAECARRKEGVQEGEADDFPPDSDRTTSDGYPLLP
jgi:hypothetical protein